MKTAKFLFLVFASIFAGIYFCYVSYVYLNQSEMVFKGNTLNKNFTFRFENDFEEIKITSFDKVNLHGILFKTPNPKGLVFYLHGNKGAVDSWGNNASFYTNLGYDIFYLDYRGFGKSEGENTSEIQVYQDMQYAYNALLKRYNEKKIIIIGYSIGTGLATYLAANNSPKTLILQAPYYDFEELSSTRVPYIPNFLKKYKFKTFKFITKVNAPIYIFHGAQDGLITYDNSERLKKIIKPTDSLFRLENQGHVGINENEDFKKQLTAILL